MRKTLFVIIPASVITAFLLLFSGLALAGGGTWKMGPFGPYWDDNSWPEFTPMYWMEEFLNRLNDDDAEIQQWMMRNQNGGYPGQYPVPPGNGMQSPWGAPAVSPYAAWQNNQWQMPLNAPVSQSPSNMMQSAPQVVPQVAPPVPVQPDYGQNTMRQPMFRSMPQSIPQRAPQQTMPQGRPPQVSRQLPQQLPQQQSHQGARQRPATPYPEFENLPNLTPQEFSRMPPQLQQQYEQAFNQAFVNYQKRREIEQVLKQRRPVYTRPDRSVMPRNYPRY